MSDNMKHILVGLIGTILLKLTYSYKWVYSFIYTILCLVQTKATKNIMEDFGVVYHNTIAMAAISFVGSILSFKIVRWMIRYLFWPQVILLTSMILELMYYELVQTEEKEY